MACLDCGKNDVVMYKCAKCGGELCFTHFSLSTGICKSCKEIKIEIPSPIRRSFLDSYEKCPAQAKAYILQKLVQEGNLWSNVGNILHDIFEKNSLSFNNCTEEELQLLCKEELAEYMSSHPDIVAHAQKLTKSDVVEQMYERARMCTMNYFKYEVDAPKPMHTEYYIEFPVLFDGEKALKPNISMTIDRINVIEDDEYEIVDYKTGKTSSGPELQRGFQVPVYIIGFKREFGVLPKRFKLLYLDDDNERVFDRVDDDTYALKVRNKEYSISLKESEERIIRTLTNMSESKWSIPKSLNGFYCNSFCNVYSAGVCPGKDVGIWNLKKGS